MLERELLLEAPIERAFEVITKLDDYPQFVQGTENVRSYRENGVLYADFTVNVIKKIHYTLEFSLIEPTDVEWHMLKGEMFKRNSGAWRLKEESPNLTRAVYQVDVQFGWAVPKKIIQKLTETQLPDLMEAFKKRIESK